VRFCPDQHDWDPIIRKAAIKMMFSDPAKAERAILQDEKRRLQQIKSALKPLTPNP
jgi:hypothetical protein